MYHAPDEDTVHSGQCGQRLLLSGEPLHYMLHVRTRHTLTQALHPLHQLLQSITH